MLPSVAISNGASAILFIPAAPPLNHIAMANLEHQAVPQSCKTYVLSGRLAQSKHDNGEDELPVSACDNKKLSQEDGLF
jgi:hypothetical protein